MTQKLDLDPRVNAFRPDLADLALKPFVEADKYVEAALYQCVRGIVPLLQEPKEDALRVSEIRYGEFVDLLEKREDGFSWVQNRNDRYVGYIHTKGTLNQTIAALMNRVIVLHTFVYAEPNLKAPVQDRLTLGSFVSLDGEEEDFYPLASGGYIFKKHVVPTDEAQTPDYVFTAGQLLGAPYLLGGRTSLGIDCSALVQLSLDMAGIDAPRDVDQQQKLFGHPLPCHWRDIVWKRGDLVFFEKHVGIMTDNDYLIHADSHAMQVVVEPLEEIMLRRKTIIAAGRP